MNPKTADIHVLLIRLSALGDVVHTLPAADLLRRNLPNAKITWVVEAPFTDLLRNNPAVDDVLIFPKKKISNELKNPLQWLNPSSELNQFIADLKGRNFNAALDFQGLFKSGAIAYLSGAPIRVGFSQARELSPIFLTDRCDTGDYFANDKHVVRHNLELAEFYLRIAGGSTPKSQLIHFPLPEPSPELIADVIKLAGVSVVTEAPKVDRARITGTNILSALIRKENRVQPHVEAEQVVAPAEADAVRGANVSGESGGSGGVPQNETTLNNASAKEALLQPKAISQPETRASSAAIPAPQAETAPQVEPAPSAGQVPGETPAPSAEPDPEAKPNPEATPAPSAEPKQLPQIAKNGERVIVLIPGTTWITKIWPKEKWAQLVSQLVQIPKTRIVLVGGPSETEMNSYIYDQVLATVSDRPHPGSITQRASSTERTQLVDLTGKTSIAGLVALFQIADIVVGADTGPLHIAVAVDKPHVIGIHGSTPWLRNGPLGDKSSVVALDLNCQPCFEKRCPLGTIACLKDLNAATVLREIIRVLDDLP